jgi:1-deoxy-D-xylulose-5-phosphate synthase
VGEAEVRRRGRRIAILAFGAMVTPSQEVGEELDATVVNMRFVKPLDEDLILDMAREHDLLVTVEEGCIQGGAGSGVNEVLAEHIVTTPIVNYGLPDRLIQHGSQDDMREDAGLTPAGIRTFIEQHLDAAGIGNPAKSA